MAEHPEEEVPEARASRLPQWSADLARQALANAIGTLIAALVLLLGGVLFGAINDVPVALVIGWALLLAALVSGLVITAVLISRYAERVELKRSAEAVFRPAERALAAYDLAMRERGDPDELEAMLSLARAAERRGDQAEADRLFKEVERRQAATDFALDMTARYLGEAAKTAYQTREDLLSRPKRWWKRADPSDQEAARSSRRT